MAKAKTKAFDKLAFFNQASDLIKPVRVHLPSMGGDVFVKRHTLAEREDFNDRITEAEKEDKNAIGVILVTCDEDGELLFSEDDLEQIKCLPSNVTTEILYRYNMANGLALPIEEQIEAAKKNS